MIAAKADIGLGLINYHFGNKEILGYGFVKAKDMAAYISQMIDILFERTVPIDE